MNLTTGVFLIGALFYMIRHRGADIPGVVLGIMVGVNGASGWVGQIATQLTQTGTEVIQSVLNALPFGK